MLNHTLTSFPSPDPSNSLSTTSTRDRHAAFQTDGVSLEAPSQLPNQLKFILYRPRIILVENHGQLSGLVTVKDVLRFTATERQDLRSPWSEQRFDSLVDEARTWTGDLAEDAMSWARQLLRRR